MITGPRAALATASKNAVEATAVANRLMPKLTSGEEGETSCDAMLLDLHGQSGDHLSEKSQCLSVFKTMNRAAYGLRMLTLEVRTSGLAVACGSAALGKSGKGI